MRHSLIHEQCDANIDVAIFTNLNGMDRKITSSRFNFHRTLRIELINNQLVLASLIVISKHDTHVEVLLRHPFFIISFEVWYESSYDILSSLNLLRLADGGGVDDGPDQDPMVPSSRVIVVPGLLSQRRWSTQPDRRILVGSHGLHRPRVPRRPKVGFDAIGELTGSGHSRNLVVSFGGKLPSFEGPGHNRLPAVPFSDKTVS
ncbi:hypothetical protein M5K25_007216 [Dendrobium thyrsiflorum]|uniref:Uncharacterized protein n=1 Tax=Dendrobium thyrsiflorum TaxID=117978 RepID=A0ABD0VKA2_DENTH